MDEEYKMIKTDMRAITDTLHKSWTLLYVALASIYTIAIKENAAIMFLTTFSVIIPVYIFIINQTNQLYRYAAYLIVFKETKEKSIEWETMLRNLLLNKKRKHRFQSYRAFPAVFSAFCSFGLFLAFIIHNQHRWEQYVQTIVGIGFLAAVIIITIFYNKSPDKMREYYISEWKKVKDTIDN